MSLKFILSQRGKRQLVYKNFIYSEHTRSKNGVNWRCISYCPPDRCKSRVVTSSDKKNGKVLEVKNDHNHVLEKSEIEMRKVKANIKKKAVRSSESTSNIVSRETSLISKTTSALLPLNKSLARSVQRERHKALGGDALPSNVMDLVISEKFANTLRGEKFLFSDHTYDNNRILIYTTEKNLKILKRCPILQSDGTFDTVPLIFQQLYTVHGRYENNLIPLVYVLTTEKSKQAYSHVLEFLKSAKRGLNPSVMIIDFELAYIRAFEDSFPDCSIHGCYFHHTQCIWRCIQGNGLQHKYQNDEEFALEVRKLTAITFVDIG